MFVLSFSPCSFPSSLRTISFCLFSKPFSFSPAEFQDEIDAGEEEEEQSRQGDSQGQCLLGGRHAGDKGIWKEAGKVPVSETRAELRAPLGCPSEQLAQAPVTSPPLSEPTVLAVAWLMKLIRI